LKLAPKAANVAKKRKSRIQTVIDLDKNSPRFKKMATRVPTGFFKISDETKKGEGMSFGEAAEASINSAAPIAASRAPRASSAASRKSSAALSKRSSSAIRVSDLNKDVYLVPRTGIGKRRLAPIAGLAPIAE
jgi:hypothetical protein